MLSAAAVSHVSRRFQEGLRRDHTLQDPGKAVDGFACSGLGASGKISCSILGSLYIALVARLL